MPYLGIKGHILCDAQCIRLPFLIPVKQIATVSEMQKITADDHPHYLRLMTLLKEASEPDDMNNDLHARKSEFLLRQCI